MAIDKIKKESLSELGGKCANCGQDDKWKTLERSKVTGTQYDYFYVLECQGEIRLDPEEDFGAGEILSCKHIRDITVCEEPEYDKEATREFNEE